jgi:hypothetical protein
MIRFSYECNSSLWPSKQDLTFNLDINSGHQISKHPNKNIGIESQCKYPKVLTFKPMQCQFCEYKHPNRPYVNFIEMRFKYMPFELYQLHIYLW